MDLYNHMSQLYNQPHNHTYNHTHQLFNLEGGINMNSNTSENIKQEITDTQNIITVELLGAKKEDIEVSMQDGKIRVRCIIKIGDKEVEKSVNVAVDNYAMVKRGSKPQINFENNVLSIIFELEDYDKRVFFEF